MEDARLRSGAAGLTLADASEPRTGPASRTWEAGAIACQEARRVYDEIMGDRRRREADEANTGPRRRKSRFL